MVKVPSFDLMWGTRKGQEDVAWVCPFFLPLILEFINLTTLRGITVEKMIDQVGTHWADS